MTRQFQIALARAYTDAAARQELYRGETRGFAALGLSPDELAALAEFARENQGRLELYAAILVKKKGKPLQKRLPVMFEVLQSAESEGWARMCSEFYDAEPLTEGDGAAHQAGSFIAHVAARAGSFGPHASLVSEVARYERIKLSLLPAAAPAGVSSAAVPAAVSRPECPLVPGPFVVETFAYDLLRVKHATADAAALSPCTTTVLFCRHAESDAVVVVRITTALASVVARCDGRSTLKDIAERSRADARLPIAAIAKALSGLTALGVVARPIVAAGTEGVHEHA
jgi:hypothetical protein